MGLRLVKKISDVQFSPGSQLNLDNDPFFDESNDRPKYKKVKLEYPLREKILNSRGQSIVYVDYKDRFRDGTTLITDRLAKDRSGLGDLMQRAGQIKKDLTLEERLGETEEASMVLDK